MTTIKLPKAAPPGPTTPFVAEASFRPDGSLQINGSVNDEAIRRLGVRHDGYESVDVFIAGVPDRVATLDFKTQVAVAGNAPVDVYNSVVVLTPAQQASARANGLSFTIHLNQGDDLETAEPIRVGGTPGNGGSPSALGPNVPGPANPFFVEAGLRRDGTLTVSGSVNDEAIRKLGVEHDGFETIDVYVAGQPGKVATLDFKTQVASGGHSPNDLYGCEVRLNPAQQDAARAHGLVFKIVLNRGSTLTRADVPVFDAH